MKKTMGRMLGAMLAGLMMMGGTAVAEESLLAKTNLDTGVKALSVELWGEQVHGGYNQQLVLLVKNSDGKIVTAYNPDIKGGYGCQLEQVKVAEKGNQLLLSVAQGDWRAATEYRILDLSKPADIKELFSGTDSMGIVVNAECADNNMKLTTTNGESSTMVLDPKVAEQLGHRTAFGGVHTLVAYDADEDGKQELLMSQRISSGKNLLADVGALLQLDEKGKWQPRGITVMAASNPDSKNTVNNGRDFEGGSILPRRFVVPGGEATYPVFLNNSNLELQKEFNKTLKQECKAYLDKFYAGEADMAFNVIAADSELVSIRLISGKDRFVHHHVNINPATGKILKIDEILDTKNTDLVPLLELLSSNKNVMFEGVPHEWYIEGENLFFVQNICGKEEATGYNIGNLHKYLLDKKWLSRKAQ